METKEDRLQRRIDKAEDRLSAARYEAMVYPNCPTAAAEVCDAMNEVRAANDAMRAFAAATA